MGTSNSYRGPGANTPLVPSWLTPTITGNPAEVGASQSTNDDSETHNNSLDDTQGTTPNANSTTIEKSNGNGEVTDRFREARSNFTRYAKSGGSSKGALGRAVSSYVSKASGGARKASQRLGSSRRSTVRLVNFLSSVSTQGVQTTLAGLNLSNLIGQPIEDVFVGLVDYICPDGGNVDEGIARNAFIETIADLAEQGISDLDNLTSEQIFTIIETFATHAIEARLCNDIGTKISIAPENIQSVERAQEQLHDFIKRSVSDALNKHQGDLQNLQATDTTKFVEQVYEESYQILAALSDVESDKE